MSQLPTHTPAHFAQAYAGEAPWDIGRPQAGFLAILDQVMSPVLDAGCGTGDTAIHLASLGHTVIAFDYLDEPIRRARAKATERGVAVDFRVADALALGDWPERFNTAIDSGLFHVFNDDDRRRYVAGLATVLNHSGRLFLQCFSDAEPAGFGPRRIARADLEAAFADGWKIESIAATRFELNPKFDGTVFSDGGPKCWFVQVQRT